MWEKIKSIFKKIIAVVGIILGFLFFFNRKKKPDNTVEEQKEKTKQNEEKIDNQIKENKESNKQSEETIKDIDKQIEENNNAISNHSSSEDLIKKAKEQMAKNKEILDGRK